MRSQYLERGGARYTLKRIEVRDERPLLIEKQTDRSDDKSQSDDYQREIQPLEPALGLFFDETEVVAYEPPDKRPDVPQRHIDYTDDRKCKIRQLEVVHHQVARRGESYVILKRL